MARQANRICSAMFEIFKQAIFAADHHERAFNALDFTQILGKYG